MNSVIRQIRHELQQLADEKTRLSGQRFFKEEVKMYGIKTNTVSSIAKKHSKVLAGKSKEELFALCEELWESGYMEESFIACQWSESLKNKFIPSDFKVFESWLHRYVNNWATCDTLCNHTIGSFIMMYPGHLSYLKRWTASDNRWVRRGAAVSLIIPVRKGGFLDDVFEIADALLTDPDDMVQKGYGWMLKVASQAHETEIFSYVMNNKVLMPRTALRYAIEKLPPEMKKEAMKRSPKIQA